MKGKYKRLVVNRIVVTVALILLQILWIVFMLEELAKYSSWITTAFTVLSIVIVLYIIGKDDNSAYKIGWIVLIMVLPLFGGLLYLFSGDKKPSRGMRRKLNEQHELFKESLLQEAEIQDRLGKVHGRAAGTFDYVRRVGDFPVYGNTDVTYYPSGEEMFVDMLDELRAAKHFIFVEYFIVPYLLWFVYLAAGACFLFFKDKKGFLQAARFAISGMTIFLIICTIFPNGLALRPTIFAHDNVFVDLVKIVYSTDTPTNVLPSMHVFLSVGMCMALNRTPALKDKHGIRIAAGILSFIIVLSTMFLKQHSVTDVAAALVMDGILYQLVYARQARQARKLMHEPVI